MSTLRVSNIEAKADVSSPSVHEKIKVTNSEGDVLVHIDGATSGISTVGINTTVKTFDVDSNQNIDFVGNLTAPNITVTGTLTYDDVTNIDSVGVVTARNGLHVTGGNLGVGLNNPSAPLHLSGPAEIRLNNAADAGNFARIRCFEESSDNGAHLAFNTGAGEVVRFRNDGNVGIGTDNPGHLLDLYNSDGTDCLKLNVNGGAGGSSKQNAIRFSVDGDVKAHMGLAVDAGRLISGSIANDFCIKGLGSNNILFATNSSEKVRITTSGNLGIGDASPTKPLTVGTTTPVILLDDQSSRTLEIRGPSTTHSATVLTTSVHDLLLGTNNTERLRITSGGKLATNGASSIDCGDGGMHLYLGDGARNDYSTSADGLIIEKNGTTGLSIDPGSSGTANIYFPNESNHSIASISHNNSTGELRVRGEDHIILSTNGNTERLRITSAGLVGVGTAAGSSSSTRLVVYEESGNAQTIEVKAKNTGGVGSQPGIRFTAPNNDNIGAVFADVTSDSLNFSTGNFVQRLRIDSNGNLGVNKTPETDWATSYRAIEIGNSSVSAYQGGAYPSIELNMNCRGTQASYGAGWKYILGMRATQIHMPYSGETLFRRANSGSADGAISWNESMRISNDGSLYHRGNNSSTVNNTDGDSLASSGYPAGGATFNKNVSVNNGTSDFGQCMNMVSHTKSVTLDGSTNHNMITIYNREGCFVGHIYVGYSTGGEGANAIYKFYTFYSVNSVTAELGPSRRSSSHTISADITSSADSHTIRVNGTGYSGNVTVGLVFLSAGRSGDNHYGVRYW